MPLCAVVQTIGEGGVLSDYEANRRLVEVAAETHNARDKDGFLACYGPAMTVHWGERELTVTPEEHWEAVLWGRQPSTVSRRQSNRW